MNPETKASAIPYIRKVAEEIATLTEEVAVNIAENKVHRREINSLTAHRKHTLGLYGLTEDDINAN